MTLIGRIASGAVQAVSAFNRRRLPDGGRHRHLVGAYEPLPDERTITDLAVIGRIPPELSGLYVRIGPNPLRPDPRSYHLFLGDGMVHGIRLKHGKPSWYRNRFIRSGELARKGGPPAAPGPRRPGSDMVNTNVMSIGGRIMALVEAGSYPVELSDTLESVAYSDFGGGLAGPFTAHPHRDPASGEYHAITYDAMDQRTIRHVVIAPEGRVLREQAIPVRHGPSIHDCGITARFVIVFDLPVTFSAATLLRGYPFPFRWNPSHPARVGLLPRDGSAADIIWCAVDPCYLFHVANCFDRPDGTVVIDAAVYETMFASSRQGAAGRSLGFERWEVDPIAGRVRRMTIDPTRQEFPRPDERFFGRPYRYAWSVGLPPETDPQDFGPQPLYRYDLTEGTRQEYDFGPDRTPGEFVFVPRSTDAPEGEGWVMGYVTDMATGMSELAILDAADITAGPVARVIVPHRIPIGFHGNWIADPR